MSALRFGVVADAKGWGPSAMDSVKPLGVEWVREEVTRTSGLSNDALYTEAAKRGLRILPLVNRSIPATEAERTDYANLAAYHARRYGPNGDFWRANPTLDATLAPDVIEILNEPWNQGHGGACNPGGYARTVKAAASAVRAANPNVRVALAADVTHFPSGCEWINAMYAAVPDLNDYFDIVAVHPYGHGTSTAYVNDDISRWEFRRIEEVKRRFDAHAASGKPFWITEVGDPTNGSDSHTETEQASFLQSYIDRAQAYGYVEALFVYHQRDSCANPADKECWFGLMTHDGSRTKPAWEILRSNATRR